jgi:hypothetical protein
MKQARELADARTQAAMALRFVRVPRPGDTDGNIYPAAIGVHNCSPKIKAPT